MSGPPAPPPEAPTLSAFPGARPGPGAGGPSPVGQVGALPRLVYGVEQLLDTIARAVPGASEDIDQAKAIVRGVLAKALQGGGPGGNPMPGGGPPPIPGRGPMR